MIYSQIMSLNPRERAGSHPSGPPPSSLRLPLFLASFWFYPQNFISLGQNYNMFRDILHKLKIFFCDDDVEKIYIRDSTVIRNNEIHRMYDEILDELGDLATVVSRNYVYGKIKDRTGLSIRHISRIINHTKVEEI